MRADVGSETVRFSFDGRALEARRGQSVAGALLAAGVTTLTRSPKYRRPRGIHCAGGYCPNCMLRVDGRPHVRSCMTPVSDGMRVQTEGSTAARLDPLRAIDRAAPLFPVGFQYRYFKHQGLLWRIWEGRLRKAAAETEMPDVADVPEAERVTADLLVVGGGPAGVAAAAGGAEAGLSVLLATRRPKPEVSSSERVTVLAPATVVAAFEDVYLIDAGSRLVEATAPASVLATGAYERAVVFGGNDRPGVMLTSALRRLALEERVVSGRSAVVVATHDSAYAMAADLAGAGLELRALVDPRPGEVAAAAALRALDVEVVRGAHSIRVHGREGVRGLSFEAGGRRRKIRCDLVGMSGGWQAADELRYAATSHGQDVVEGEGATPLAPGDAAGALPVLQAVGSVAGTWDTDAAVAEGWRAGALAAGVGGG
jgi:NADPH-dependent 2,4-dienoyl-CoA reductase/sulfur reductase-like enzyme